MTLDPLTVAQAPKAAPLNVTDSPTAFTCALCGTTQEPYAWRVKLPGRLGKACPGCAEDHGWIVRWP